MKATKKIFFNIQTFRALIQIISFIFLTGLFTITFGSIKSIYLAVLAQSFTVQDYLAQILLITGTILLTVFTGRFFCGWMCSFGALMDLLHFLSTKLTKKRVRINEKLDTVLKGLKYFVLAFSIVVIWTLGNTIFTQANPWNVFGMLTSFSNVTALPAFIAEMKIGAVLLALIIIGGFFIERFFCRYLCPLGAIFAIFSKPRILKIRKHEGECGKCMGCSKSCSMGINLNAVDTVNSGECINCLKCLDGCHRDNTAFTIAGKPTKRIVAALVAVLVIMGTGATYETSSYIDSQAASNISYSVPDTKVSQSIEEFSKTTDSSQSTDQSSQLTEQSTTLTDGVYEGTGSGFKGTTTLQVTVEGGTISNIETVSTGDDMPYYNRAFSSVAQQIVSAQNASVDAVSGATFSSNGIMEAVANAIGQEYTNNNEQLQSGHGPGRS
jgi:polyferredoxin/uncharacterized protein with FMN-binding domain